jgi:hypothetical protein
MHERDDDSSSGPLPPTPRDAAVDFIRAEIHAGATYHSILTNHPSSWRQRDRYSATVGGTIFNALGSAAAHWLPLDIDQVGVYRLGGEECWGVFPLREIYREAWQAENPARPLDELMEQGTLF